MLSDGAKSRAERLSLRRAAGQKEKLGEETFPPALQFGGGAEIGQRGEAAAKTSLNQYGVTRPGDGTQMGDNVRRRAASPPLPGGRRVAGRRL